ncbi:hypothetical protein C0995_013151 [Termitomyces sp. Mi166|nr:hypothetical protein C0995_013151 [Termitomyces sp. Mi166\
MGGGHTSNPGFSSTGGVHVNMKKFSQIAYDVQAQTAVIGAGLTWDDVYTALAPYGINVVGGRNTGVGVAGFTLGGGYSWLTNQYGLTIDTVVAFELVKPDGDIVNVTESSDPDLFFALKGIITRFTLKTFPQGQVWGGYILYTFDHVPAISAATVKFSSTVTDPKAGIITTYFLEGIMQLIFYDGPGPPVGVFDDFLAIPYLIKDICTRDFLSLVRTPPSNATYGQHAIFQTVSLVEYTPTLLDAIYNETVFWGSRLSLNTGLFISHSMEPSLPTLFSHGSDSAYPPSRAKGLSPFNLYFAWILPSSDDEMHEAVKQSARQIKAVAVAEGQTISEVAIYPNYAIYDTPLEGLYGLNVPRLQAQKTSVDPTNVMGLAGDFKL